MKIHLISYNRSTIIDMGYQHACKDLKEICRIIGESCLPELLLVDLSNCLHRCFERQKGHRKSREAYLVEPESLSVWDSRKEV